MRHDWIFDVLSDLRSYALTNGLPALAEEVEHALRVARREIGVSGGSGGPEGNGEDGAPPWERPH